ncbi:conserved hypothetical protein [Luteimonas sp. 9C]|uniref:anti-sigma factor n=1 Tax=Luteimonas sp. 9C TaxID=2653148 RepID=UPI0012EFEF1E|nr:anti-sigma factor [Luteimonas sp. 9C]VXC10164.1 conserved hypothetical protein [Luteimonas sp. 9C]
MNVRDLDFDIDDNGGPEPPRADLLAGEYVLGVLDAPARASAEARIARDPGFARLVAEWDVRLAPWFAEFPAADVPAHVWPRIRTALGWTPVAARPEGLWHSTGFWRGATALAAVVAIVAVLAGRMPVDDERASPVVVAPTPAPVPAPAPAPAIDALPVTTLAHEDGSPAWLASVDAGQGRVLVVPVPADVDAAGRVAELWLIPEGGAPTSLGLLPHDRTHAVEVPAALQAALVTGATLAVSLEPPGGSPGNAPTGPVVASGALRI